MTQTKHAGRLQPPPCPSKYDIIPIHTSDRAAFKQCRRRWAWSSPARRNLVPKVRIHGIRMPFWYGTGIHYALERYYHPGLKEDPTATWESWFNLQYNGGLVTAQELANDKELQLRDPRPVKNVSDTSAMGLDRNVSLGETVYHVAGLRELLPDPQEEEFEAHRLLGIGMMNFYKTYAPREDNFTVIMVEHDFSVPILDPDGEILYMKDNRDMPEDWKPGNSSVKYSADMHIVFKPVHARGRQDVILQDNETGRFGIMDHKTAAKIDDDYFRGLDLDEQCTTYLWAGEQEALIHDLDYKQLDFVIYNALRKAYPSPPNMTTRGLPSLDRQKESTTAEMFEKCIKENNLDIIFQNDEKMQLYYSYLVEMGDKLFIQRDMVTRNKAQRENAGKRIYYEAMDMLSNPVPYPSPSRDYNCLNCVFRAPCIAAEDGSDFEYMLSDGYESNYDR